MTDTTDTAPTLDAARSEIAAQVRAAGAPRADGSTPELAKVHEGGVTFGLAYNGVPIPLDGEELSRVSGDELPAFLARHADAIAAGEHDDVIGRALGAGPGNVTARVRSVEDGGFLAREE